MIADETLILLSQLTGQNVSPEQAEILFRDLSRQEASSPHAMVTALVELLQLNYNKDTPMASGMESLFSDILSRDRFTGYFVHPALRTIYLDFAIARSTLSGQDNRNFLIMGDYLNLSSVNEAIGRSTTNDVMATMAGIHLDCMTRAGVTDWLYYRSMGDEITYIVVNTDAQKVESGLKEAEKITGEFIAVLGLERLRHKKYPNRTGAGLITYAMPLSKLTNHRQLKQQMDEAIQSRKKSKEKFWWQFFQRVGIEPDQFHNRASEQRIDKALHKFRHYRNAAQFVGDSEQKTGVRNPLNPMKSLLIGRAIAWPRDDRIEYLRHHHNDTKVMLRADVYNLGGLNAVFGHDGADQVKGHLIRILHDTIDAHHAGEIKMFDCGGGIIDIVLDQMPGRELHKLIEALQSNIYYQILSHSVAGYASAYKLSYADDGNILLADLVHPRGEYNGTGLILAVHPVESRRSLPEIIERLDKIAHRTKMHNFAYLWTDERCHVSAFALNKGPEAIPIGTDRERQGLHYLPFTDALRNHINENDLPNIFERPVGQICETVLGTDMQAVLGFKKAIRLLQDRGVHDDDIEKIASYEEMDNKLNAQNLPPLSVVSTQNRPAFVNNEREAFKTMALAEKLEGLSHDMTNLILQTQACFRTLKLILPHGHLAPVQAAQVLSEDIQNTHVPTINHTERRITEALFLLTRLFDRGYAALGRNLPDELRDALSELTFEILKGTEQAFEINDEMLLAQKIHAYIRDHQGYILERGDCIAIVRQHIASFVDKTYRKNLIDKAGHDALEVLCRDLLAIVEQMAVIPEARMITQLMDMPLEAP